MTPGLQAFAAARVALDEQRTEVMGILEQHSVELVMQRRDIEQKIATKTQVRSTGRSAARQQEQTGLCRETIPDKSDTQHPLARPLLHPQNLSMKYNSSDS